MCIKSKNKNSPGWTALMSMGPVRGCGLPQNPRFCFLAIVKDQRLVENKNNYQNWPMSLGNYVGRPRSICPRERVKGVSIRVHLHSAGDAEVCNIVLDK